MQNKVFGVDGQAASAKDASLETRALARIRK